MCDPVSIGLAVVGAASSLYGGMQQASAAKSQQQAIQQQNMAMATAQNEAFQQRIQAGLQQTAAQAAASRETISGRSASFDEMRQQQMAQMKNYQDVINAENERAQQLRQVGDTASQQLLEQTSQPNLAAAQQQQQDQTALLLQQAQNQGQGQPTGPMPSDPTNQVTGDPASQAAMARRTAEAATNIRDYGAKVGQLASYAGPGQAVNMAIASNKYGIMPAAAAAELLRAGNATRLLPTQVGYQAATGMGSARDILLQSKGQSALDAAGLSYGNAVDIANLQQQNADVIAKNRADQAVADAQAKAAQGGIFTSLGNLALKGAGYTSGLDPMALTGKVKSIFS